MTVNDTTGTPLEEPLAELERQLISAYVAGAGEDLERCSHVMTKLLENSWPKPRCMPAGA